MVIFFQCPDLKNNPHCLATNWPNDWSNGGRSLNHAIQNYVKVEIFAKRDRTNDNFELTQMIFCKKDHQWCPLQSWADLFHHLMALARTGHCPGGGDAFGKVENLNGLHNRSKERTFFGGTTNLVTILCTFLLLEWYYCNTWTKTEIFRALPSYEPTHD